MIEERLYDVAIIGGGLAGLSLSIQLSKKGYSVVLLEKESYPYHKVCGEYVSLESWDFIESLGLPLKEMQLPIINTLFLTAPNGKTFTSKLPLGGFGISRYLFDHQLSQIAKSSGADVREKCKVDQVVFVDDGFEIIAGTEKIRAKLCCAAWGKRSNIDVKWNRDFLNKQDKQLNNFIAVKYHLRAQWPEDRIGLHNFEDGYCGISKIEGDRYCCCYMTRADILKRSENNIKAMEEKFLYVNTHLKALFTQSEVVQEFPVTISQINFSSKTTVENGVLMLGDTAGMITPLCGNGMSIALHTSKIAGALADDFLQGSISRQQLEHSYSLQWRQHFSRRLQTGRLLQKFFGKKSLSNFFVSSFKAAPFLAQPMIRMTHGKPF
jgi:flavin-dependent dehydrogenase